MSTIKAIGGTLSQFGKKLAVGASSSYSNVQGPEVEVNVPPEWESTGFGEITNTNIPAFVSPTVHFLEPPGPYIYHPGDESNTFSTNGIVYSWDKDFGSNFALNQRVFVSASDRNTNDSITLTLRSESLSTSSLLFPQTDINDINVIFPDNGNSTNINTGSFYLETSSNFQIFNQHDYAFVVRAEDENGSRSRFNNSSIFNNFPYDVEYKAVIYPYGERPFIITQSNDVSISASTSPDDHINEMTFNVGNEGSPDFSVIPDIYIKQRQKIGGSTLEEIVNIHNAFSADNDASLIPIFKAAYYAYYATTVGDLPHTSNDTVFTRGLLPTQIEYQQTSSMRFFPLHFDSSSFEFKLSAKDSPYHLTITASTGQYTPAGVGSSSPPIETTASIYIVVNNENPVWVDTGNIVTVKYQDIDNDTKRRLTIASYPSASDPGGDNISLSTLAKIMATPDVGLSATDFDMTFIQGTDTGSYYIVTSSTFPANLGTELKGNARLDVAVQASDECSPAGTQNAFSTFLVDAPPSWSAVSRGYSSNEKTIGNTIDAASYATVFDDITHIGSTDSGDVTLDTGSGFDITCNDPRIQDNWFIFTPTDAINGNNATYTVATSSNFNRIDANALVKLYVTASDNKNQTSQHEYRLTITNIDDLPDVLGDLYGDLRAFITPRVNGVTTQLENDVLIESVISPSSEANSVSGSVSAHIIGNGGTPLDITAINANLRAILTDDTSQTDILYWDNLLLNGSAGSVVFWFKHDGANSSGLNTLFGNNNFGFAADGTTNAGIPRIGGATVNQVTKYFLASGPYTGDWHMITFAWTSANAGTWYVWLNDTQIVNGATTSQNLTADFKASFIGAKGAYLSTPSEYLPLSMSCAISFDKTLNSNEVNYIFTRFSGSHGL